MNFYPIVCDNLYSSIPTSFFYTQNTANKTNYLIENHFTTIIEFSLNIENSEDKNPVFQQEMKSFLEQKDYKINFSFFKISNDFYTDFKKMDEIINFIDKLISQNEKIHLHSENDDKIVGSILACYLLKNQVVDLIDVFGYINYLRSLSRQNEKELIFDQDQINFIIQYDKFLN